MNNNKTYYHLILDRSGSMSSCWHQTMIGWSEQIVKINQIAQENPDQEIYVSLCLFNDIIDFPEGILRVNTGEIPSIEKVKPNGGTALFDAIGLSIDKLEFVAGRDLNTEEASVVMIVLTDGHENASKRFSGEMIRKKMDALEKSGLWNIVFIGADFDITSTANYFNAKEKNRVNFSKSDINIAFSIVNESLEHHIAEKKKGKINDTFFK